MHEKKEKGRNDVMKGRKDALRRTGLLSLVEGGKNKMTGVASLEGRRSREREGITVMSKLMIKTEK